MGTSTVGLMRGRRLWVPAEWMCNDGAESVGTSTVSVMRVAETVGTSREEVT